MEKHPSTSLNSVSRAASLASIGSQSTQSHSGRDGGHSARPKASCSQFSSTWLSSALEYGSGFCRPLLSHFPIWLTSQVTGSLVLPDELAQTSTVLPKADLFLSFPLVSGLGGLRPQAGVR